MSHHNRKNNKKNDGVNVSATKKLLTNQLKLLVKEPLGYFKFELKQNNIFEWHVWMIGPVDSPYEGGIFKLLLKFPEKYPYEPPTLTFLSDFWHPNVYKDGKVCISILHSPGVDEHNEMERPEERWLPIHTPETILVSVMSMIADPNCSSPANVDASVEYRKNRKKFEERVKKIVKKSKDVLPKDFVMPKPKKKKIITPKPITDYDDIEDFEMEGEDFDDDDFDDDNDKMSISDGDLSDGELSDLTEEELKLLEEEERKEKEKLAKQQK